MRVCSCLFLFFLLRPIFFWLTPQLVPPYQGGGGFSHTVAERSRASASDFLGSHIKGERGRGEGHSCNSESLLRECVRKCSEKIPRRHRTCPKCSIECVPRRLLREGCSEKTDPRRLHREGCSEKAAPRRLHRKSCSEKTAPNRLHREGCFQKVAPRRLLREGCTEKAVPRRLHREDCSE